MRRPVKYKTRQAARNRLIGIVTASVLGVAVIGGASAAVLLSRDDDAIDGIGSDTNAAVPAVTDTAALPVGTDSAAVDTEMPVTDTTTQTPPDTELQTEPVTQPPVTEAPVVTDAPVTTEAEQTPTTPSAADVATTRNYKGGYLDLSDYLTATELKNAAKALRADGYTAVMVELKYDNGKLAYKSNVKEAKDFGANPSVAAQELDDIVDILHGEGLYVTGRVCALRDDLAAKGNTDAALMNTAGFRYSDGASRWISVYSEEGQDYILALLAEMKRAGVDEIMLRDYALPADAGTTAPKYEAGISKTDAVKAFLGRVDSTLSGAALNLEMDVATIAAGKDDTMGIDCSAFGAIADSITADMTLSNLRDGMRIGEKTIADVDADPAKTVETLLSVIDASPLNIRPLFELTGNASHDAAQIAAAQNRGYGAYQMTERVVSMTEK